MAIVLRRSTAVQSSKAIVCHFTSWFLLMFFWKNSSQCAVCFWLLDFQMLILMPSWFIMPRVATATVDQLNVIISLFVNLGLYNEKLIFAEKMM
jgi:hypothetical protein